MVQFQVRNGSRLAVKTIMNNMRLQEKGSSLTPKQSAKSTG